MSIRSCALIDPAERAFLTGGAIVRVPKLAGEFGTTLDSSPIRVTRRLRLMT